MSNLPKTTEQSEDKSPRVLAMRAIIFSQTFPHTHSLFHGKASSDQLRPRVPAEEWKGPRRNERWLATVSVGLRHSLCQLCTISNGSGQDPSLLIILLPTSPLPKYRNNPEAEPNKVPVPYSSLLASCPMLLQGQGAEPNDL